MSVKTLDQWAEWLDAKVLWSAWSSMGDGSHYTITRDGAGGAFTARYNGVAIRPAGRLKEARAAAVRHNGRPLEWVDTSQKRALYL